MKMAEAMSIINNDGNSVGFMVAFENLYGGILGGDNFPDKRAGEPLIKTENEAWSLAHKFAAKTVGRCVNIYVVDHNYRPVEGYEKLAIDNRK